MFPDHFLRIYISNAQILLIFKAARRMLKSLYILLVSFFDNQKVQTLISQMPERRGVKSI